MTMDYDYEAKYLKVLKGKVIEGIMVDQNAPGARYIKFQTSTGDFAFEAEGDCCSQSWFENISGASEFDRPRLCLNVEAVKMKQKKTSKYLTKTYVDHMKTYGEKIICEGAQLFLEYRNNSNGYYGGSLRRCTLDGDWVKLEDF
jgi:hypothetical protein